MGIFCQVLINRPRNGLHKAGQPVTGIVRYTVDEAARYKDVVISLIGKGKCSWQKSRKNHHKGRNETRTYIGREVYTEQCISLHNKGSDGAFVLPIGTYERPFSFVLPNNIPSSFKDNTCTIKYKLVIKFEKPNFLSVHQKFDLEIDVIGNVHPIALEGRTVTELKKTLFKPFKKRKHHVHVETEIANTTFKPGNQVKINFKVTNDSDVVVPSVKAELICNTTYTSDCGRRKKRYKTINECTAETPSVPDNAVANMSSAMLLAGYLYTIQHSRIMFNEYSIQITLRLPMPHINTSVKIPIVIGEKYGEDDVEMYMPGTELEEPPSYFQVMNEDKEDKERD